MVLSKLFFSTTLLLCFFSVAAQDIDKIINATEVERIEKILSADDMQGRKTFTPGIDKAADFIAAEFAKSKLSYFGKNKDYFQQMTLVRTKTTELSGKLDAETLSNANTVISTSAATVDLRNLKGYERLIVKKEDDFSQMIYPLTQSAKNLLVLVDTAHLNLIRRIQWVPDVINYLLHLPKFLL